MISNEYREYLNSDKWYKKKQEVFKLKGKQCHSCGAKFQIDVHHQTYKNIFHENEKLDLIPLCRICHDKVHIQKGIKLKKATNKIIKGRKDFVVYNEEGRAAWGFKSANKRLKRKIKAIRANVRKGKKKKLFL